MRRTLFATLVVAGALAACGGGADNGPAAALGARPPAQQQAAATDPTTGALRVFQAFNGRAPTAAEFNSFTTANSMVLATGFAAGFTSMGDAALANAVLANMGVTAQTVNANSLSILQTALAQYFAAFGTASRGVIVNNLAGLLAGLESDGTWGTAARGFNTTINTSRATVAASTSNGSLCLPTVVAGFAGDVETASASSGAGDGGASGSGGGAAAGGGLGKVLGGTMRVTELAGGNVVGEGTTDSATGLVTIRTCSLPGPFLLTLEGRAGARYFDEGRNTLMDFPAGSVLHALVDRWDEHVGVSPITEAAYRYALNNVKASAADIAAGRAQLRAEGSLVGLTVDQVRSINAVVAAEVNARLPDSYQLASAKTLPTPIDASSPANSLKASAQGRSAVVNGGLVQAANHFNQNVAAPALTLANTLARDLTDGRIDGFALDGTPVAGADTLTYHSTQVALGGTIGANAVTRRFGSTTLAPALPTVDREAFASTRAGGSGCDDFFEEVALLSDASVTVRRRPPTNQNGTCSFVFDAAENARVVTLRNFLTGIKSISQGGNTMLAVRQDGTVLGWGRNYCGALSPDLPNGLYTTPQVLAGLRNITSASTNGFTTILRDDSGNVFYFGAAGGIGLSTPAPANRTVCALGEGLINGLAWNQTQYSAMQRAVIPNAIEVHAGWGNLFALTTDGTVYGWGDGVSGMLANSDGTLITEGGRLRGAFVPNPTPIAGLSAVREVVVAAGTLFALQRDGRLFAWGEDDYKLLGAGLQRRTLRPTAVAGLTNIVHMANAFDAFRLQRADGSFLAWGAGPRGSGQFYYTPVPMTPSGRVRHIAGSASGFSVFLGSGAVVRDLTETQDVSATYR